MTMVNPIDTLDVYIVGRPVGRLHHLQGGKLSFSYHEAWMEGRVAIPLSLSMPTITRTYKARSSRHSSGGCCRITSRPSPDGRRGSRSPPEIRLPC